MFEGEIIFYNGFNLLVDIIIGFTVWFFTKRAVTDYQNHLGFVQALEAIDEGSVFKDHDGDWVLPCEEGKVLYLSTGKGKAVFLQEETNYVSMDAWKQAKGLFNGRESD